VTIRSKAKKEKLKAERAAREAIRQGHGKPDHPVNAAPSPRPSTLVEDGLDPRESLALELAALQRGWVIDNEEFGKIRAGLVRKVAAEAAKAADPNITIKALTAIARTEQRDHALKLQAMALLMRQRPPSDLPQQVEAQERPQEEARTQPKHELIRELINDRVVRAAYNPRSSYAAESCNVSGQQVREG